LLLPGTNFWLLGVAIASVAVGIYAFRQIRSYYQSRELVRYNQLTVYLSGLTGLLTTVALILG